MRARVLLALVVMVLSGGGVGWAGGRVWLLAGAGLRPPVEELIRQFSRERGIEVRVDYAGSGQLLARYLASGKGGLFMPGALKYLQELERRGLVRSVVLVARHTPVVAVRKAVAWRVGSLEDLAQEGLRVGLGDPRAMALGWMAQEILRRAGIEREVERNVVVRAATVKQLAFYVAEGMVDAAIIARSDAWLLRDRLKMIRIPQRYYTPDFIGVGLLRTAVEPAAARALQEFLGSMRARRVFARYGFLPVEGGGDGGD